MLVEFLCVLAGFLNERNTQLFCFSLQYIKEKSPHTGDFFENYLVFGGLDLI